MARTKKNSSINTADTANNCKEIVNDKIVYRQIAASIYPAAILNTLGIFKSQGPDINPNSAHESVNKYEHIGDHVQELSNFINEHPGSTTETTSQANTTTTKTAPTTTTTTTAGNNALTTTTTNSTTTTTTAEDTKNTDANTMSPAEMRATYFSLR